jgi:FixJ family two-component response regulator
MQPVIPVDTSVMPRPIATLTPLVYIVDDDASVRESIKSLIEEAGWRPEAYSSAKEFLNRPRRQRPSCLILDVALPDLNGLEVQQRLSDVQAEIPIIFVTGRGDIPTSVKAMKAGAAEFLTKPFEPDELVCAIENAVERSRASLEAKSAVKVLRDRHQTLTPREREVMALVLTGRLNKQIGADLGIKEITVKAHRSHMMRKMKVRSLPELIGIGARLGLDTVKKS